MTGITLRAATPADIPALAALGRGSFVAHFGQLYRPEDLAAFLAESYSEAAFAAELANPARLYQLAERAGTLAAFCKLGLTCGFPAHARGKHVLELKQLYAAADATGSGVGAALMAWAMGEFGARGADEVQISVYSENYGAQRFYARYGFEKIADITFKVGQQLDPEFLFAKLF